MSDAPERVFACYSTQESPKGWPRGIILDHEPFPGAVEFVRREADAYRAGLEAAAAKMDEKARLAQSEGEELARQGFYALADQQRHHAEAFAKADAAIRAMMEGKG